MEDYSSIYGKDSIPDQEINHGGNTRGQEDPGKLIPVEEREAKELRGLARVDSGEKQPDGWKDEKPIPASAVLHATNYRLDA
jgi:hypothetical protein